MNRHCLPLAVIFYSPTRRRSTKMTGSGDLMLVTLPAGQEAKQTTNELIVILFFIFIF